MIFSVVNATLLKSRGRFFLAMSQWLSALVSELSLGWNLPDIKPDGANDLTSVQSNYKGKYFFVRVDESMNRALMCRIADSYSGMSG